MARVGCRRLVALFVVATVAVAPALLAGAGVVGTDSGSALGDGVEDALDRAFGPSSAGAEPAAGPTLGPPNWPAEPLPPESVDGRRVVENASERPNSAIGHVGATGVLVSEYHVLTSAHVVADENGTVESLEEIVFTPGLRAPPDGPASVPYGRAGVREVHVHPGWDGVPPEQDLALIELDRPVGAHAGTMRLAPSVAERPGDRELRQAGYVNNVTGHRPIASEPRLDGPRSRARPGYLQYCAPLSHGDSGSPIWTSVDGDPTVLAVNSDWAARGNCRDATVGVAMTEQRVDRVRDWMADDARPPALADLVLATPLAGPVWVPSADALPDDPIAANATDVSVGTRVYNNGPLSVGTPAATDSSARIEGFTGTPRATVSFVATIRRPTPDGLETVARGMPLCDARIAVDAYDATTANCRVSELPSVVQPGDVLEVSATVDPDDRVPEYDSSPLPGAEGTQPVGRIRIADR